MPVVGVAIDIPEPFGTQLRESRASFGDPLAETVPTHITLIPPISIDDDAFSQLQQDLSMVAVNHGEYEVSLRGTGTFRPVSPVVFVAVVEGISPTEQLAAGLRGLLDGEVSSFPYHPHVTVAQCVDDAALDRAFNELSGFACRFTVDKFCLYIQDEGNTWQRHREYQLG